MPASVPVESVSDGARAAALLAHPLRVAILRHAGEPRSASEIAARLGEPRQKVNYHVTQLRRAGFLRPAGRRRRRGLVEQRVVATARRYVLAPEILGALGVQEATVAGEMSAAYLVALAAQMQSAVARVMKQAAAAGQRVATLSLSADIRFTSAGQRAAFARALERALRRVVARHTAPDRPADDRPGAGRPFRLVIGCYPSPRAHRAPTGG